MFGLLGCAEHVTKPNSEQLPKWIVQSNSPSTVVCSAFSVDPEEAKVTAENNCLSSAAKSQGVKLNLNQKTVDSLSGSDSGETAAIESLNAHVRCDWTNRYLQQVESGYRVWLECSIRSLQVEKNSNENYRQTISSVPSNEKYKRSILQLTTIPKVEKIIVSGSRGDRVIDPESNTVGIEIKEGDKFVEAKKLRYKSKRLKIPEFDHGSTVPLTIVLDPEM